jgi:hypothetical protein
MYPVAPDYIEAIYADSRAVHGRVSFDISDVTATIDVSSITVSAQFAISDKNQVNDNERQNTYNYSTWETDRFRLDGSFTFADSTLINNGFVGYVSNALCDAMGVFSPNISIAVLLGGLHSSIGITVTFDVTNNEFATEFDVIAYDASNAVNLAISVTGNTDTIAVVSGAFLLYKKIEVVVKTWSVGYRRARVAEIDFGVFQVYDDNTLIRLSLIEEMDLTSGTLPSAEFIFTVDNSDRTFNILNPSGIYAYLQQRQQIIVELGLEIGGIVRYVPLGKYLLSDWQSDEGSLTTTFTANTNLDLMATFEYENLISTSRSLYAFAIIIFAACGITNYTVDPALTLVNTLSLVERRNCKAILQMIAIAGQANIYMSRDNHITLVCNPPTIGTADDLVDMNNMYSEPKITLDRTVKSVSVTYFASLVSSSVYTVSNSGVDAGDAIKLESNTLINTLTQATAISSWMLSQKQYRGIYEINWRGNPPLELNDVISIENSYGTNKSAIITRNEISYQGYLSAKTKARGVIT